MQETDSSNKRIAKNTILLYLRQLVASCIGIYTSRVLLEKLGVDNLGIYSVVGGFVSMFSIFNGSLTNACNRFIAYYIGNDDTQELKRVFSTAVIIHIIIGVSVIFIAEIVGVWFLNTQMNIPSDRLTAANWVFQFSLLAFFFNLINTPYQSLIVSYERMSTFAYLSIVDVTLKLLILYLISIINYDKLITYSILMFGISFINRALYRIYSIRNFEAARNISYKLHKDLFHKMFSFAGWNLFGTGSMVLRNQGIDILINIYFGVVVNAAKSISNQIQGTIYSFVSNFQMAINPQITKSYAANDITRTKYLLFQGSRYSFFLLLFLSMPFMIGIDDVLNVWLTVVPSWTNLFVRLTFVYLLLDTLSRFLIVTIMATGVIRNYQIIVGGIKLLAVPLTYIYIFFFNRTPVAGLLVNIALEIICLILRLYFAKNIISLNILDYSKKVVFKCVTLFLLSFALLQTIPFLRIDYIWYRLAVITITSLLTTGILIYAFGMNNQEKRLLHDYVLKKGSLFKI